MTNPEGEFVDRNESQPWPEPEDESFGRAESADAEGADERPRQRKRRRTKIILITTASVVVLALVSAVGYLAYLNHIVSSNVSHESLVPRPGDPVRDESGNEVVGEDGEPVVATAPPERDPNAGDALNILIVGTDSRDLTIDRGRSDVMVLMHIAADRESVQLVHFPRDLFVEIPGHQKNKINAAYAFGGAPLLVQTIQPLVGVPIDHVAIINFDSFKDMTDAVGGVEVNVAEASPGFPAGMMEMDGETGLEFVRERYALSQGDISRGQRQQAFIKAVLLKGLSGNTLTNPVRLANFVDAATENLVVDEDLEVGTMRSLAFSMRGIRGGDITFITAPWSGIGSDPWAGSIVIPAEEQFEELREHLSSDTMQDYTDEVSPRSGFG